MFLGITSYKYVVSKQEILPHVYVNLNLKETTKLEKEDAIFTNYFV